ncbi:MAG: formylmethanofuran dehydrogenase subunit A [Methylobacteriaceae bacterium]|nr:formylmethanofuran dehydrogenase subunit A [Methylobacteriaceae bacterium]
MLTCITGGYVIDPPNRRDGIGDLWMENGRVVTAPASGTAHATFDATDRIVMAGAIDIHSHIAGGNVNTARLLLPEEHIRFDPRTAGMPFATAGSSTFETGCAYAAMGFTTVVEPAITPHNALQAHLELADVPIIDKAILTVLGNDDYLLALMRDNAGPAHIRDYVAWMLDATRGLGIKVINAGGAAAFKENVRSFSLEDIVPAYGVTSHRIVETLQRAVIDLGVPHPLHVHCNNLGLPGNVDTAIATIEAAQGLPLHLAHLQFYAYGRDGARGFSSGAPRLAEAVNAKTNITVDVGQVMFGQTVTVSCDVLRQFMARGQANPSKWVIVDGDSNGGGIVPYKYRATDFHNVVQWAAGLELFLLIDDPTRVFFTTDHPNGAPFTTYPEIFALLMDRELRAETIASLPPAAIEMTSLAALKREYTLNEIAVMTRSAPAKLLGLADRGHLGPGAIADVAVYAPDKDKAKMFRQAALVFKDGELVVRDGKIVQYRFGRALSVRPRADRTVESRIRTYYEATYGFDAALLKVPDGAIGRPDPFETVGCNG